MNADMTVRSVARCALVLLLVVGLVGCTDDGAARMSVAEELEPPSVWSLESAEVVTDPACTGEQCTSAVRRWSVDGAPRGDQLVELATAADWSGASPDGACEPEPNRTGPIPYCTVTATDAGFQIELRAAGPLADDRYEVTLTVR